MALTTSETFTLTAPDGTKVTVAGTGRRDLLIQRGYTEKAKPAPAKPDTK